MVHVSAVMPEQKPITFFRSKVGFGFVEKGRFLAAFFMLHNRLRN